MKCSVLLAFLLTSLSLFSQQAPQPYWQRAVGGFGDEWSAGFVKTYDKGYAILSSNYQSLGGDINDQNISYEYYAWVVKLDSNKNVVWQNKIHKNVFPGLQFIVEGTDIIQTNDHGIVVIGTSMFASGDDNMCWAIKYDKDGNYLWKYEQPLVNRVHNFSQILENADGSLIICGDRNVDNRYSPQQGWLVCLKPNGELNWQKNFLSTYPGSSLPLSFRSIDIAVGGGYIVTGHYDTVRASGSANTDFYVARISTAGDVIWKRTFGGSGNDVGLNILTLPDNTYMVSGLTTSNDGDVGTTHCIIGGVCREDVWLLKIDPSGNLLSKVIYGDFDTDIIEDMAVYKNGVYMVGYSNSYLNGFSGNRGGNDVWGLQVDFNLNRIAAHGMYGGPKADYGKSVLIDSADGNIFPVILGTTASESGGQVEGFHDGGALNDREIWIFKLGFFNTLKGYAFYDYNKNGSKEANEPFYKRGVFTSAGQSDTITTYNTTGSFQYKVLNNDYTTRLSSNDTAFTIVPASKRSLFDNYFNIDSMRFALQLKPGFSDISIAGYPLTPSRPGFETVYEAMLTNKSGDTVRTQQWWLVKDPRLTLKNATPAPSRVSQDSIFWNYDNLKPTDTLRYTIRFTVSPPPVVQLGDTLRSYFYAPFSKDVDTTDNAAVVNQVVGGSFDPNDKTESHNGKLEASKAMKGEFLTYMIRFQNTGTDTAFTIVVRDTLDNDLRLETLEMLKASHPYVLLFSKNSIEWKFNKINLPDSNVNEPASHGYIIYRIKTKQVVSPGSTIQNRASIYFDYNLPIVTNVSVTELTGTTTNPSGGPGGRTSLVKVYPNPAKGSVWLSYSGTVETVTNIAVYDLSGRLIASSSNRLLQPFAPLKFDIPFLAPGLYYIRLAGEGVDETHKIVVVE